MKREMLKHRLIKSAPGIILILTDAALKPIACNREAAVLLAAKTNLGARVELPSTLPREIAEAIGDRTIKDLSSAKIALRIGNEDFNCRTYLMEGDDGAPSMLVLHIDRVCSVLDSVQAVAARCRLTGREQEVLEGIAAGLSSKELAEKMSVSPNTIKVFVRLIMIKMGVTTRGGIVAQILQSQSQQGREEREFTAHA